MDELIRAMSTEDIQTLMQKYSGNESVTTMLNVALEERKHQAEQVKLIADFEAKLLKLAKLPQPPESIHNVYMAWGEVEEPDGEAVEVELNGVKSMRQPTKKAWRWSVVCNKGFEVKHANSATTGAGKATKRAIRVYKRNGTILEAVGNFANATRACEALKIEVGADSAMRKLINMGYITEPYSGDDVGK
jgi:hypothetical protein